MDHKRHWLLMLVGCGIMMVGAVYFFSSGLAGIVTGAASETAGGRAGSWLWLLFLACPLMHLLMMRGHGHHGPTKPQDTSTIQSETSEEK